jgi:hypothetical protein
MADETTDENVDPSTTEDGEVSEDVKTPQEEDTSTPSKIEEKTVPYQRFKEVNDKYQELRKTNPGESTPKSGQSLTLEAIKVGKKLEKYSEEEIDSVAKMVKSSDPNAILEALDNPFIKQGIELERKKVQDKNKVLAPGSNSPFGTAVKSTDELRKMSAQELQDYETKLNQEERGTGA